MKIGMNLLLWTAQVGEAQYPVLETLAEIGYDGVEVPVFVGQPEAYQPLGKKLAELKLECTSVIALTDPSMNLVSDDKATRQAGQDDLKRAIDCTAAMGGTVLCGPLTQAIGHFTGEPPTDKERERAVAVLSELAPHAEQAGVQLMVEPINRFECYMANVLDQAADLVRTVNHPAVQAMYDTHHGHIEEKSPTEPIRRHADVIGHIHYSENDRATPGTGQVDFEAVTRTLKEIGYDGWITIEAFSRAVPEIAAATAVWRDTVTDQQQLARDGYNLIKKLVS
jgi:D-psicose/D-tagatose/L-ribulose 3-epimerase